MIAADLLKTDGVLTAKPDDSLASALAQMHSSHDAVFVTEKNQLLGAISPYHVLYRSHFPAATKVKNCLFLAPKLKPDTKTETIARLMLEAKVYFLPVVTDKGKWLGVVSYRRLLRQLTGFKVKPKPLVKIKDNITISQARNLMKSSGVSRLIVVTGNDRLSGILTRYDLSKSLGLPPSAPVKTYIKHGVATFRQTDNPVTVLNQMLDKRIGSMIMINQNYQPIGLLSVRDCLAALAKPPVALPTFNLKLPPGFPYTDRFLKLFNRYWKEWRRRFPLLKFDLKLNTHKNAVNAISGYKVLLQAKSAHQKEVVAKGSGRSWKIALRKSLARLTRQLKKQ